MTTYNVSVFVDIFVDIADKSKRLIPCYIKNKPFVNFAVSRNRTRDTRIFSPLLYLLS